MNLAQRLLFGAAYPQEQRVATFISGGASIYEATSVTFSGKSIGAEASDRIVIVMACSAGKYENVTNITLNGTTMTKLNPDGHHYVGALALPTGTTANITVTKEYNYMGTGIAVYSLTGAGSSVQVRASASDSDSVTGTGTLSISSSLNGLFVGDLCFWCDAMSRDSEYSRNRTPDYSTTGGSAFGFSAGVFVAASPTESVTATLNVSLNTNGKQGLVALH